MQCLFSHDQGLSALDPPVAPSSQPRFPFYLAVGGGLSNVFDSCLEVEIASEGK